MTTEKAILAGGCFWGMEELFRHQPGVVSTRVGYSGGDVPNATYRNHGTHAESIEVVYDPEKTDFRALLEFFFQVHDPTTKNRQGNDIGTSYRSAIFYTNDEQKRVAEDTIADVDASGLWPGKVVTEVTPAGDFWEAEPEHQDYLQKHPHGYTCHFPGPSGNSRSGRRPDAPSADHRLAHRRESRKDVSEQRPMRDNPQPITVTDPRVATAAVQIVALLVSPTHAFEGRPADGPRPDPQPVERQEVTVRAGLGLVGDRYFNHPAHRQAAVTVFAAESLDALARDLGLATVPGPHLPRRNIVLRGFPVDQLAAPHGGTGAVFGLDSGTGEVRFQAHRPANPCAWMNEVLAPGAFRALRGHGGVRCTPLDDGVLRLGPATLTVARPPLAQRPA